MIELHNIYKEFDGKPVLNGTDLRIEDGETLLILGRSGCGKSVTLKLILRLLEPDDGQIIIDGEDTTDYTEYQMLPIRKRIGMLFQGAALFDSMTVWENLAYPLIEHTDMTLEEMDERIKQLLGFVEMTGSETKMPSELSGGMKKRVALARAMVMKPDYIFYDEPTTGLDPITAATINELVLRTQKEFGITSVVVTHDLISAHTVGNRFAFLHNGKIIYNGDWEGFKNSNNPAIKQFIGESKWEKS